MSAYFIYLNIGGSEDGLNSTPVKSQKGMKKTLKFKKSSRGLLNHNKIAGINVINYTKIVITHLV